MKTGLTFGYVEDSKSTVMDHWLSGPQITPTDLELSRLWEVENPRSVTKRLPTFLLVTYCLAESSQSQARVAPPACPFDRQTPDSSRPWNCRTPCFQTSGMSLTWFSCWNWLFQSIQCNEGFQLLTNEQGKLDAIIYHRPSSYCRCIHDYIYIRMYIYICIYYIYIHELYICVYNYLSGWKLESPPS